MKIKCTAFFPICIHVSYFCHFVFFFIVYVIPVYNFPLISYFLSSPSNKLLISFLIFYSYLCLFCILCIFLFFIFILNNFFNFSCCCLFVDTNYVLLSDSSHIFMTNSVQKFYRFYHTFVLICFSV